MNPWVWLLDAVRGGLTALHDVLGFFGDDAWGWAIIGLTVVIRVLLLPLAIKQTHSMKAMQALQPEVERIRKKYKVDRDAAKKSPEKVRAQKAKQNEELMALYKERGVNPAASCLPLLLQAPIFFALFRVLNDRELILNGDRIADAPFYVFSPIGEAANADVWGWVLIVLMVVTMFVTQRQMQSRVAAGSQQMAQQKILMYVMPVFLAFIAQSLPIGVLLYWVTTNLWQMAQQAIIVHEVEAHAEEDGAKPAGGQASKAAAGGAGGSNRRPTRKPQPSREAKPKPKTGPQRRGSSDHLPRRKQR